MAGKVTLSEVKNGTATIDDLRKINAILDMTADLESASYEAQKVSK